MISYHKTSAESAPPVTASCIAFIVFVPPRRRKTSAQLQSRSICSICNIRLSSYNCFSSFSFCCLLLFRDASLGVLFIHTFYRTSDDVMILTSCRDSSLMCSSCAHAQLNPPALTHSQYCTHSHANATINRVKGMLSSRY